MKKLFAMFAGFLGWFLMGSSALAMCIWFAPPGRIFMPADSMKTLVVVDGNDQKLIVQPQWEGNAEDFALVMPFPGEPELAEAPEQIFNELEDLTNPEIFFAEAFTLEAGLDAAISSPSRGVEVIERQNVGDYEATTLSASNSDALLNWLNDNGYEVPDDKSKTLDYYIENETDVFVALKVNQDVVNLNNDGSVRGELSPLEFSFSNREGVMLPLRLMAGDEGRVDLTIYTLSDNQWFVPGAEVQFSRKVAGGDFDTADSLRTYDARGKWLVRNQIQFNPAAVETDLSLLTTSEDVIVTDGLTTRINPDQLDPKTGLIESQSGQIQYVEASEKESGSSDSNNSSTTDPDSDDSNMILIVLVAVLGVSNLFLLNRVLSQNKPSKGGSDGK